MKTNKLSFVETRKLSLVFLLSLLIATAVNTFAAPDPAELDRSFKPTILPSDSVATVRDMVVQPDGKTIIVGLILKVNGQQVNHVARFNADGTLDAGFDAGGAVAGGLDAATGNTFSGDVKAVALQPDGKVIIAGVFSQVARQTRYGIARLNADGSFDSTFNANLNPNAVSNFSVVTSIAVQSDGKILLGTDGTIVINTGTTTTTRNGIVRLNSDGSLDAAFNPLASSAAVITIAVQTDGKILIGGNSFTFGSQTRSRVARLNADGSLDASFVGTTYNNSQVTAIAPQADGKIYVGGDFSRVGGQTQESLARLNADGTRDTAFATFGEGFGVSEIAVQSDGKVIYTNNASGSVYRVNPNGTRDTDFTTRSRVQSDARRVSVLPDNRIVVAGAGMDILTTVGGFQTEVRNFVILAADGTLDNSVNPDVSYSDGNSYVNFFPTVIAQPDGKVLYSSDAFFEVNRVARRNIVRFNSDGSTDTTFNLPSNLIEGSSRVITTALQPDGKILYSVNTASGSTDRRLARLNADGSLDASFSSPTFTSGILQGLADSIAVQPNGQIIVRGDFTAVNGQARTNIVRFNADGSLDAFNPTVTNGFNISATNGATLIQPDGKFLLAGVSGGQSRIVRFNADGSLDASFVSPTSTSSARLFALQPDGKVLFSGLGSGLSRLNASGSIDSGFAAPSFFIDVNTPGRIGAVAALNNGKILVGGRFNLLNSPFPASGIPRSGFFFLNANGSLDTTLGISGGATAAGGQGNSNLAVAAIALQPDGNALIAGFFQYVNNFSQHTLARLKSSAAARNNIADFDGDGKADVSVFRPGNGTWYLQNSTAGFTGAQFGASGDRIVPADYDGDGKTDLAVYRNGIWYLNRTQTGFTGISFGTAEDIPVPADYDGDGKADVAVFRPSSGTWYLQRSQLGFTGVQFGANGDKPVAADYDGDGKTDVAVNRGGVWYIQRSQLGFTGISFGTADDRLTPADYDGDGKADVAVFRPSNGTWYLQRSQLGFTGIQFGANGDTPAPGDYDGDGKADVAVFRSGAWYLNRSTAGFVGVSFGAATDSPAPAAFVR